MYNYIYIYRERARYTYIYIYIAASGTERQHTANMRGRERVVALETPLITIMIYDNSYNMYVNNDNDDDNNDMRCPTGRRRDTAYHCYYHRYYHY